MTTCEPGASEVFTHGLTVRPFAWALRATSPAAISTLGLEVLVHEVMAAMTTAPSRELVVLAVDFRGADELGDRAAAFLVHVGSLVGAVDVAEVGQRRLEGGVGMGERDAVLRALRSGDRGDDRGQVERQGGGEDRVRRAVGAEHALRLGVGLDQGDALGVAAGRLEVGQRFLVDREEAAGGAVFRRHVGDRRLVLQRQVRETVAVELDELADDALLAQHLGDGEHQVGGGDAFRQAGRSCGSRRPPG